MQNHPKYVSNSSICLDKQPFFHVFPLNKTLKTGVVVPGVVVPGVVVPGVVVPGVVVPGVVVPGVVVLEKEEL